VGIDAMTLSARLYSLIGLSGLAGALLWAFWPTLAAIADKWSTDPQYSHGFLVPVFAAYLLWHRRQLLPASLPPPSPWGLLLIGAGVALYVAGAYVYFDALAMVALLPVLAGLCLCFGGGRLLCWAWPAVAFLVFMLPLPYRLETGLSHPLQRLATVCSSYALQTIGFAAVSEGNIIVLDNARIGVVEACNGLGMLVTFFAITTGTILVVRRPLFETVLIVLSAIPIALVANVIRITATGILYAAAGSAVAEAVFHDLAGWLMMPLALGFLWMEYRVLAIVLVEPEPETGPVFALGIPAPLGPAAHAARPTEAELV
jgi:exosortase